MIKAITLHQPWAELIAIGAKKIETRSWPTKHRGQIAIHAAAGMPKYAKDALLECEVIRTTLRHNGYSLTQDGLQFGKVIAIANLYDCIEMTEGFIDMWVDSKEYQFGNYEVGRYAWMLGDVKLLKKTVSVKGMRGLWNWEPPPEAAL